MDIGALGGFHDAILAASPHTTVVTHYTPDTLVAKITLDSPPTPNHGATYWTFRFTSGGCTVDFAWSPGQSRKIV